MKNHTPEQVLKIKKAIDELNSNNIDPSYNNISNYLNISYSCLYGQVYYYKNKGYDLTNYITPLRLQYKDHPLYKKMYTVWRGMVQRCHNPNHSKYHRYGERGIIVCERWRDPDNFFLDMHETYEEGLTLDRINNDSGYYKENCKWSNQRQQKRNTCKTRKFKNQNISILDILESLNLTKYKHHVFYRYENFNSWDEYIEVYGIEYNNKIYCCIQHFYDENNIFSGKVVGLMERYYHYDKCLKKPVIQNIRWYIKNCRNFSKNLSKLINNEKISKKDIIDLTIQ